MKLLIRNTEETIKIKDLFDTLEIPNKEHAQLNIPFELCVKTPFGWNVIQTAFRTEKQSTVTTYFGNGKTLKTSLSHRLKSNGEWEYVSKLTKGQLVECDNGTTKITNFNKGDDEILYDISVKDVHCYYSNGILSHNSWILTKLGVEAMKQGKNVVHFTLELGQKYVGRRYDCNFTGIDFQNIVDNKDAVIKALSNIDGFMKIKYYPIKTVSALTLKNYVERIQTLTSQKVDLLVVDYADILRPIHADKNANSYSEAGGIYEELRAVAGELQIPCWTASQSNRCFCIDSIVYEKNKKHIRAKELAVGDEVLTHKGYKKVSHIFESESKPTYRIKLKSGKYIDVSAEHRFPTQHGNMKSIRTGLQAGDKLFTKKK